MTCGGGVTRPCNGHGSIPTILLPWPPFNYDEMIYFCTSRIIGKCMSMYELALWSDDNGDSTDFTYG